MLTFQKYRDKQQGEERAWVYFKCQSKCQLQLGREAWGMKSTRPGCNLLGTITYLLAYQT